MKPITYFVVFTIVLISCQQPAKFNINGKVENGDGKTILLCKGKILKIKPNTKIYDSTTIENGQFLLSGNIKEPDFYTLLIKNQPEGYRKFVLDNTEYTINGDAHEFYKSEIVGGDEYELYLKFRKNVNPLISAYMNSNRDHTYIPKIDSVHVNFIRKHPDRFASLHALEELSMHKENYHVSKELYQKLDEKIKSHSNAELIYNRLFGVTVGKVAPNFSQPDTMGNIISLDMFKDKIILLEFWASWCNPCRKKHPELRKIYNRYKTTQEFEIISISLDQEKDNWLNAIKNDSIDWIQLSDLKGSDYNKAKLNYGVHYAGSNFLIDESGKIIGQDLKPSELETWLYANLKK